MPKHRVHIFVENGLLVVRYCRFQASGHRPSSPRLVHAQQQQQCGHKLPAAGSAPGNAHISRPVSSSRAVSAAHGKAVGLEQRVSSAAVSAAMLGTQRCSSPLAPGARPSSSSSSGWQHVQQAGGPTRGSSASPCHDGSGNRGSCANSCADARGNSGGYGSSGSSAIDVLAALQQSPPEILVVLFDPQNQVIITGGNDGLIKVSKCWQALYPSGLQTSALPCVCAVVGRICQQGASASVCVQHYTCNCHNTQCFAMPTFKLPCTA